MLGQIPRWQHAHGKSGGGAWPAGQPLQPVVREGAHAAHGLGRDVGVLWPQHLADSAGWGFSLCLLSGAVERGEGGKKRLVARGGRRERTGDMAPESHLDLQEWPQ